MSKVAAYLQAHLVGEVMASPDAREYFSTDASIYKQTPQLIVYPRAENDVRKVTRFAWQLAERGRKISITSRGLGTDVSGAAIGSGIMLVFPAHMNKIITLDSNKGNVVLQPGINFGKLQQTLQTHGLFLPPYPASLEYSTVGGAISNNAAGEKSVKYGVMKDYVRNLRVVLANGEVITTGRISKRELNKKKGLATFEGELYRAIDGLISENEEVIENNSLNVSKNNSGYDIWGVKDKDGSFDLTPLIVGSQGTLGVITEAHIESEAFNPRRTTLAVFFDTIQNAMAAVQDIKRLEPSAFEMVDDKFMQFIEDNHPNQLNGIVKKPYPKIAFLIEFDDLINRVQRRKVKKAQKILSKLSHDVRMATDEHDQEDLWKLRHSVASIIWHNKNNKKSIPLIDDAIVPLERFEEFLTKTKELFTSLKIDAPIWGHAGDGGLHVQPAFDISQVGDRQRATRLLEEFNLLVISLGGSISSQYNDGRLRAPFIEAQYGQAIYDLFRKVKQIFDPYEILNPGVKIDVDIRDSQSLIRNSYSLSHLYDHMPRT